MHSSESCLVKRQRNRWFGGMTPFLIGHHQIPQHAEQQTWDLPHSWQHPSLLPRNRTPLPLQTRQAAGRSIPDAQQLCPNHSLVPMPHTWPWWVSLPLVPAGYEMGELAPNAGGWGVSFHCTPPGFTNWNLSNWGRGWCLEDVAKIFLIGNEGLQRISRELGSNRVTATECGPTCDLVAALPGSGAWWARRSAQPGNTGLCMASKEAEGAACRAAAKGDLTSQEQRSHGDAQQHGPASLQERYWDTRCLIAVPSPSGTHSFLPIKMPISKSRGTELLRHSQKTSS